ILPAVVEAAEAVALDPASAELRPPVRAARRDDLRRAVLAAIEGEVLAHDTDGPGMAGEEVSRDVDWLPEPAEIATGQRAGAGVREVEVLDSVGAAPGLTPDHCGPPGRCPTRGSWPS